MIGRPGLVATWKTERNRPVRRPVCGSSRLVVASGRRCSRWVSGWFIQIVWGWSRIPVDSVGEPDLALELGRLLRAGLEADLEVVELELEAERLAVGVEGQGVDAVAERETGRGGSSSGRRRARSQISLVSPPTVISSRQAAIPWSILPVGRSIGTQISRSTPAEVVVDRKLIVIGMLGAAERDDRLAARQRPGGAELGPALLAPAEDAIVERPAIRGPASTSIWPNRPLVLGSIDGGAM